MPNLKRRTRYLNKLRYQHWLNSEKSNNLEPNIKLVKKARKQSEKRKQRLKTYYLTAFKDSLYVEDCRYHPCKITKLYDDSNDFSIDVISLVNGITSSCSLHHCGVLPISEDQAIERKDFILKYGMTPYFINYQIEKSWITKDRLIQYLKDDKIQEQEWQFNKNQSTFSFTEDGFQWLKTTYDIDYQLLGE